MSDSRYDDTPISYFEEDMRAIIDGTQFPSRPPKSKMEELLKELNDTIKEGGGGGGTTNYNQLSNKPEINGVTLSGNQSSADLGIPAANSVYTKTETDTLLNAKQDDVGLSSADGIITANGNFVATGDITDGNGNKLSDIDELEPLLPKSYTGNPIIIENALGGPVSALKTTIESIQDLHGYGHPWAGGAEKNKFMLDLAYIKSKNTVGTWNDNVYTVYGGTITIVTDDDDNITAIKVNGTFSTALNFVLSDYDIPLSEGTYIFTCDKNNDDPVGTDNVSTVFISNINGDSRWRNSIAPINDRTFTITDTSNLIRAGLYVWANIAINYTFYPMIRLSSDQTGFTPWKNKCSIIGRSLVVVDDTGLNLVEDKISGANIEADGHINLWENGDMQIAKVKKGETYAITSNDYAVYGFFTSKPTLNSVSYNGQRYTGSNYVFTAPIDGYVAFRTGAGYATPQCEVGSTATPYQPYQHSSVTISLGQTVYGADINWETGVGTVDRVLIDNSLLTVFHNNTAGTGTLASFNKTTNGYASRNAYTTSIFKPQTVSAWEALDVDTILTDSATGYCVICTDVPNQTQEQLQQWLTDKGAQICLYLANPFTIQLTPEQLELLKGYNRVTIEGGTIELTTLDISKEISEIVETLSEFKVSATSGISTDNGETYIRFGKDANGNYGYYEGDDTELHLFGSSGPNANSVRSLSSMISIIPEQEG